MLRVKADIMWPADFASPPTCATTENRCSGVAGEVTDVVPIDSLFGRIMQLVRQSTASITLIAIAASLASISGCGARPSVAPDDLKGFPGIKYDIADGVVVGLDFSQGLPTDTLLSEVVQRHTDSVHTVSVQGGGVSQRQLDKLISMPSLRHIYLEHIVAVEPLRFKSRSPHDGPSHVVLSNGYSLNVCDVDFSELSTLQTAIIGETAWGSKWVESIKSLPCLVLLKLHDIVLTDSAAIDLAASTSLREIRLERVEISDEAQEVLQLRYGDRYKKSP